MKYIMTIILCLGLSLQAYAKNEGKHGNKHYDDDSVYHGYDRDDDAHPGRGKNKRLPPGLQKKYERTGELPPGWQKKLRRGAILDDELYEYGTTVVIEDDGYDYGIEEAPGTEILRIEDRIIRITKDTREILEILGVGSNY